MEATEGRYAFDWGMHSVIWAKGVGFTAEYMAKGVYENTIGEQPSGGLEPDGMPTQKIYIKPISQSVMVHLSIKNRV